MSTGYLYDPAFLLHHQHGHPECRDRLSAVICRMRATGVMDRLVQVPFNAASDEIISQVHQSEYVQGLKRYSQEGGGAVDASTYVTNATYEAAALAVGASLAAVHAVLSRQIDRAFALVRPPGHHAHADHGEGFCFFNNVVFSAKAALGDLDHGSGISLDRVMIVDFDVHHGNGTESFFYDDRRVLYVSLHQRPLYPSTGSFEERGEGEGKGYNVNVPLPVGVGDVGYQQVFDEVVLPLVSRFTPQLILVSAGYDIHWREPLANMSVSLSGINSIVSKLLAASENACEGRMVFLLEGGYDLDALSFGVLNTMYLLNGEAGRVSDPIGRLSVPETPIDAVLQRVKRIHSL